MAESTFRRFERIVAILIRLQSRRIVRAQDLSEYFGVTLRTIYRDIRTLEKAGVPVRGEAGIGYSIYDGYRLPPVTFTREEASSFIAAEKLTQRLTDRNLGKHHASAMTKIRSVLRGREKDWLETLETNISVESAYSPFNDSIPDAMEILFDSIATHRQVKIRYQGYGKEHVNDRMIEPVGLFHESGFWYVYAWCHLRDDYRQFRTDRLHAIARSDQEFKRVHGSLSEHRKSPKDVTGSTTVRIMVDKSIARYIRTGRKYYGFVAEKDRGDRLEMHFETLDLENGFPRWYLMFADYAEILEPLQLKERVKEIIRNINV